jgi:phage terminase large subunit-like protein
MMHPPPGFDLDRLTPEQQDELLTLLEAEQDYQSRRLFYSLYPERDTIWTGPTLLDGQVVRGQTLHARSKYPRHLEFFRVGATHRERCFMAANRVGKTFGGGGYELACHLTGQYPAWWEGRRFNHPISAWAAGDTYETTRDIIQLALFGSVTGAEGNRKGFDGRGIVPGDTIGAVTWRQGVADLADTVRVKHAGGEWSVLGLKSYDQGRRKFQGTAKHVIWLDEEPPLDVYGECLIRTATTDGIVLMTFTPLLGISDVVLEFMPAEQRPGGFDEGVR